MRLDSSVAAVVEAVDSSAVAACFVVGVVVVVMAVVVVGVVMVVVVVGVVVVVQSRGRDEGPGARSFRHQRVWCSGFESGAE